MNRREFGKISAVTTLSSLFLGSKAYSQSAKSSGEDDKLKIAILIYDKMTALDAVGPYEILSRLPNAAIYFVGETPGLKRADTEFLSLNADYSVDELKKPDILLLPGGDPREVMKSEKILNWVREAHKTTKFTTSVCTGSMILGAAGLLAKKRATTHWALAHLLAKYDAEYVSERYVETGKIITSAGVSAGIDMSLFLVERLTDRKTAEMIQLSVEYDPQPPVNSGSLKKADKETVDAANRYFAERRRRREDKEKK